ncbi:CYTH domain-containing protein [Canibacter sp. lx-45]|uniref:CYTH domain-containing protein n=1 Tax=Canibacter zhuwentaonis TaxID=2837491 RepID=UPI001BDC09F3|nr:CYTH domain-containing protein [Canibacter zhuwentaonis]
MTVGQTPHIEVELKLEASLTAKLPEFFGHDLAVLAREEHVLRARYYDTPARDLARAQLAVRYREGGKDAGWHLKQRITSAKQAEYNWSGAKDELPRDAADAINGFVPGAVAQLEPLAEIVTLRKVLVLGTPEGAPLYEIADDTVHSQELCTGVVRAWREWEIEALTESCEQLPWLRETLAANGAYDSLAGSKIARAAGVLLPTALTKQESPQLIAALALQEVADLWAGRMPQLDLVPWFDAAAGAYPLAPQQEAQIAALRAHVQQLLEKGE